MKVMQMTCPSCNGPLKIPDDVDKLTCSFCGSELVVQRGDGYSALKLAEAVSQTIEDVGKETQSTIREGTSVTQTELKRLQLGQELSSLQLQLSNIQSEIRALEMGKKNRKVRRHLKDLRQQETNLKRRIYSLQASMAPPTQASGGTPAASRPSKKPKDKKPMSPATKGCLLGIVTLMLVMCICTLVTIPIESAFLDPEVEEVSDVTMLFMVTGMIVGLIAGSAVFAYFLTPDADIWKPILSRVGRKEAVQSQDKESSPEEAKHESDD